ncbi:DUF5691 domain-containing protein [Actinomadura sp. HBU206391]|uniref:DUF5691 domain-containing protein n=1 Tax=Actinomadura sp. HBU206391 TaxID=2731692 RepID=UPI00164F608E|nr:DUF5691 domain-containing protein [Actinomadura sp. HBU206391]MBC6460411.1 hypothetical protein [Actinomadura sp. HBU206391]
MNAWTEHVSAALLGTQRRPAPRLPEAPEDAADPAGRLLDQAAVLTVRRRAGLIAGTAEPIAPAPAENAPPVPPEATRRLRQILAGERARVLPEWLERTAGLGYRVPAGLLPDLLEKGRTDRTLRPLIARAAGRRGVWLALQNTDWAYLVAVGGEDAADDPGGWETGTRARRIAHLVRLRATDPPAALAALRATWDREPAPDRAVFLATFERGLSAGDEEFLEAALDDRGQDVRRIAADLLARLPGSAYGRRMAERARACLRGEHRTVRLRAQQWIVVEPPAGHDDTMQRDGIPFHAAERIGNRAGWLREVLARTPLATWTELFDMRPMEVVCLPIADAVDHDVHSAKDVHLGWARAAVRQRDAEWARALLKGGVVVDEVEALADLLSVLPAGERDGAAADLIRWVEGQADVVRVLDRMPGPWTGELADAVVASLLTAARQPEAARFLAQLCRLADERLTPDAVSRLDEITRDHAASWPLTELTETLRFRHHMLEELR